MSTVRLKRKHVLDSDSDEDEADAPAASVAEVRGARRATSRLVSPRSRPRRPDASASAPAPRKRLASAADREAERAAAAAHTSTTDPALEVVTLDDDSDGDSDAGDEDEDEALRRCAKISRRLRRALGQDVGSRDGPLSPGSAAEPGTLTSERHLVTVDDVAAVAGEEASRPTSNPTSSSGSTSSSSSASKMSREPSSQTRWASARRRRPSPTSPTVATAKPAAWADGPPPPRAPRGVRGTRVGCGARFVVGKLAEELERWAPSLRVGFFHGAAAQAEPRQGGRVGEVARGRSNLLWGWRFRRDHRVLLALRARLRRAKDPSAVASHSELFAPRAGRGAPGEESRDAARGPGRGGGQGAAAGVADRDAAAEQPSELESLIHLVLPGLLREGALADDGEEVFPRRRARRNAAARAARVKTILAPFILRRLKEEVATELIAKRTKSSSSAWRRSKRTRTRAPWTPRARNAPDKTRGRTRSRATPR